MDINLEWTSHPENPLIRPAFPAWLIGDPVVLPPEESPDGMWHMFTNSVLWVYRYTSPDGIRWKRVQRICHGMRAFVFKENGEFFLFYERHASPRRSVIMVRRSRELTKWSGPQEVLAPELSWETPVTRTVSCPCVVRAGDRYRMYYSAASVFLKDLGFCEPLHIGIAESDSLLGPWEKMTEPILSPSGGHPFRSLGAGAIKVYADPENKRWVGFNNGIYRDEQNRTRSAIMVLTSGDGVAWDEAFPEPVIRPGEGWKKALVYQLCIVKRENGEVWLYCNARDGWRFGVERIGLEIGRPSRNRAG